MTTFPYFILSKGIRIIDKVISFYVDWLSFFIQRCISIERAREKKNVYYSVWQSMEMAEGMTGEKLGALMTGNVYNKGYCTFFDWNSIMSSFIIVDLIVIQLNDLFMLFYLWSFQFSIYYLYLKYWCLFFSQKFVFNFRANIC